MAKKKINVEDNSSNNKESLEEKVSAREGFGAVADIFSNKEEFLVENNEETLAKMKKDLEKKIANTQDSQAKSELKKELLVLEILILQIEKIDKEAAVILNNADAFGKDFESDKLKEKKKKERDKKQKALLDKLNEFGISNLDIEIKPPTGTNDRAKGGMQREPRTR